MQKVNRIDLTQKIIKEVGLPSGKQTVGFFTREQLMELSAWCEKMNLMMGVVHQIVSELKQENEDGKETATE